MPTVPYYLGTHASKNKIMNKNKSLINKKNEKKKFDLRLANLILGIVAVVLGTGYIVVMNDFSVKGMQLSDLKRDIRMKDNANKELELRIMSLESFTKLSERAENLKMVKVDKVDYLTIKSGSVALGR